jgi:hypothetical protein
MSPKGDDFRVHARAAEASAEAIYDPELKRRFLELAHSWYALADMADRGEVKLTNAKQKQQDHT